ncbi:MAG: alpha/beta hydrolase [Actinomycetales bacterium]|nr:alpha/beta hydrolase [Actinomycetales bacterium]
MTSRGRYRVLAATVVVGCALSLAVVAVSASGPAAAPTQASTGSTLNPQAGTELTGTQQQASADYPAALRPYYQQRLQWTPCSGAAPSDFVCAGMRVPISYANPKRFGDITIAVTRRPATSSQKRLGSLVVNPGGPGGSGIEYAQAADMIVSASVLNRYDLVGFDPRGVGASAPLSCLTDAQIDAFLAADATPDTPREVSQFRSMSDALGKGCLKSNRELARRVDTESAARDMDILRGVLGDPRMTYLGKSYGTFLGSTYARLFPNRVGRFVLDGVVDPQMDNVALSKAQAMGFERAMRRFLADCARLRNCPLRKDPKAAYQQLLDLIARTDAKPIPTSDPKRPLTQSLLQTGLIFGMYDSAYGWPAERNALRGVLGGDGTDMLDMIDFYVSREDGHYKDNSNEVIAAVNCIDRPDRPGIAAVQKLARTWSTSYPMFGEVLAYGLLTCERWPAPAVGRAAPWRGKTAPVLIIGNTYDPATPVEGAKALRKQMHNSRYIEWVGDGHTAYRQGSSCVDSMVDRFYLSGTLPAKDQVCRS